MKTIDIALLDHKRSRATTLCGLLLVGPLPDGSYRGFAGLDDDVTFTPAVSIGPITFQAMTGVDVSAFQSSSDLAVDNAEATTLPPLPGYEAKGFTQAEIDAGALDKVKFVALQVNYNDLTDGRCEIVGGGTIGEVRVKIGRMTVLELQSLSKQLMQQFVQSDSLSCRAIFGSQPIGTGGGVVEERFPCGYDLSSEWVNGTVTSVGTTTDMEFTDSDLTGSSYDENYFAPGMVEWLTGDNAGQMIEVDTYDVDTGAVALRFPSVSAITVGDTYRIRRHCTKQWTGHNSCETFWGSDKAKHFRGEPHIPVGDAATLNAPGAGLARGTGGTGE